MNPSFYFRHEETGQVELELNVFVRGNNTYSVNESVLWCLKVIDSGDSGNSEKNCCVLWERVLFFCVLWERVVIF